MEFRNTTLYSSFTLSGVYSVSGNATRGVCYAESYDIKCVPGMGQPAVLIAGTGLPGFGGDGGPATSAPINIPRAMLFDSVGNLLFVDSGNARIRKVNAEGIITTVWKSASNATVKFPKHVATDSSGALY